MGFPNHDRYHEYKDEELDAWIKDFPYHADRLRVYREQERRQWIKSEVAAQTRAEDQSRGDENRHQATLTQGKTILYWTKWAVAVGVVVPIAVALIAEIPFSRLLPAKASRASPASSPQMVASAAPSLSPTTTESPSESRQASQTPELTATPE